MLKKYLVSHNNTPIYVSYSRAGAYTYIQIHGGDPVFDPAWTVSEVDAETFANHAQRMMIYAGMTLPTPEEAQDWAVSEAGEMMGARQGLNPKWKRNNPDKHTDDDPHVEAADLFMMAALSVPDNTSVENILLEKYSRKGFTDTRLPIYRCLLGR